MNGSDNQTAVSPRKDEDINRKSEHMNSSDNQTAVSPGKDEDIYRKREH